ATIGGFTALYCGDRPYAARAIALAAVALGFAVAVMFGLWLQPHAWAILPALALVAMFATWLCNAMRIGPAGAYLFVLACAASTAIPADHLPPWQAGLLVLGGGMGAWLLHTVGILLHPRKPERRAVLAAARAVAAAISADANGHPRPRPPGRTPRTAPAARRPAGRGGPAGSDPAPAHAAGRHRAARLPALLDPAARRPGTRLQPAPPAAAHRHRLPRRRPGRRR